ncbi:hypothetical protein NXX40_20465 [Parabacteroides distasonis]|nr:hypothetical protein [Parabacteroides distasonis]
MITHYILHLYLNYIREKSLVPREILVELAIILMVNLLMKNIGGTYAQDVEGYDDDFIDDVLGGEPEAYWNLD